jgi:hypothetical protein
MLQDLGLESCRGSSCQLCVFLVAQDGRKSIQVACRKAIGGWFSIIHAIFEAQDEVGLRCGGREEAVVIWIPEEGDLSF